MKLIALALTLTVQATAAAAACRGLDYREHLPPAAEARLEQEMAATPFARGNHWVATKGGRSIHVIGTMHGGDFRMGKVMRTLRPALAEADLAALADLDPAVAVEQRAEGRAPWQALAGFALATGRSWRGELLYSGAPRGVGYHVAIWSGS